MKKFLIIFGLSIAGLVCAQDKQVFWSDSHEIINVELAVSKRLQDQNDFMSHAVKDYNGLIKAGVIDGRKAAELGIMNHVDFCDYLLGYWDTDYSELRPNSAKAMRENNADAKLEKLWTNAQSAMALHKEMMNSSSYIQVSGIETIAEILNEMSDYELNRNCSPSVRLANYERRHMLMKFTEIN